MNKKCAWMGGFLGAVTLVGVGGVERAAGQTAPVRTVALVGQPAPGIMNGTITGLTTPVVGDSGQIWFVATVVVTPPGTGTTVMYRADSGGPIVPVYTSGQAPDFPPNNIWSGWSMLTPGDHGEIAFLSGVQDVQNGTGFSGLFVAETGAAVQVVARLGGVASAPGLGVPFNSFTSIAAAPGLRMVVKANTSSTGINTGIWVAAGPLTKVCFEGEQAVDMPAGVLWGDTEGPGSPSIIPSSAPVINLLGNVAFKMSLTGAGVTAANNEAIWYGSSVILSKVAHEGEPVIAMGAPPPPAGTTWLMLGPPSMNDRDEMAFLGVMTGGGVTSANDEGLFVGTYGNVRMVLREDDPAPGLQGFRLHERDSTLNVWTFRNISINNDGKVAFITGLASQAGISNSNDSVAYVGDIGAGGAWEWTLIGRQGEAAPTGTPPPGDLYGDFVEIGITNANDIALVNVLNNVNRALFAGPLTPTGPMHGLIARRNGPITIAPGDVRTIGSQFNDLLFSIVTGGSDGKTRSFSNAGNLAFKARFSGGEGVFEATLRPVAQPPGDRDGDGLPDAWEMGPLDLNEDGVDDINLAALGANPDYKDLFVEIDVQREVGLSVTAVDLVVLAFDDAPVMNPNGVPGIRLHAMFSDQFSHPGPWFLLTPGDFPMEYPGFKNQFFGDPEDRASPNIIWRLEARRRTMRYMMVINETLPTSYAGIAELNGNDCALVFGRIEMAADVDRAGTLMHELGHMLGLNHGGRDDVQGKPNYPSVMNYALSRRYPFNEGFWRLDYCRESFPTVRELGFDETIGVRSGASPSVYSNFRMPFGYDDFTPGFRSVGYIRLDGSPADVSHFGTPWTPDGMFETSVTQDLNYLGPNSEIPGTDVMSLGDVMESQNDWNYVNLRVGVTGAFAQNQVTRPPFEEPGPAAWAWIAANFPRIPGSCAADFNKSGSVSVQDLFDFLAAYFVNSAWADINRSGGAPTVQDIFDYLAGYFAPC